MFENQPYIITEFSEETIMEGMELADQNAVLHYEMDDKTGTIKGEVEEGDTIYKTVVCVDDPKQCSCTCGKKFCKHQAALLIRSTSDYSKNYIHDVIEELDHDEIKDLLNKLVDLHPELIADILPIVFEQEGLDFQEELEKEFEEDNEDDDPTDQDEFILEVLDHLSRGEFSNVYFTIIDYIDALQEEETLNIDKLKVAVDMMVKLHLTAEELDPVLFQRINQWMDAHQNSYVEKYNINIALLLARQDLAVKNKYASEAEEIFKSNYLSKGPSTTEKVFDLVHRILEDEELPNEAKEYPLEECANILGDIFVNTRNNTVKKKLSKWYNENSEFLLEAFGVSLDIYFYPDQEWD